ncbi:MAG: phosphatase PAP2 family protein, partial [Pseudobdellovibrio sp.]
IGVGSGLSLAAQYYFDDNSNHWQNHARTIVWTTVTVTGMKYAFGEQRPGNKNYEAFPSGHTAISFATATSLTYAYGYKAALIAYPIAALVGLSRMADDMHWASDVVGGAFWGVLMARACEQDDTPSKVSWLPLYSRDFFSVSMTKNF